MAKPRHLQLAMVLAAIGACGWFGWRLFGMPAIPSHRGDGGFRDLSRREPFANRGYDITLPKFDLGEAHEAEYSVKGLANIGRSCGLYVVIPDPENRWRKERVQGGRLRLELLDSKGRTIVRTDGELGQYIWSGMPYAEGAVLYQFHKSNFTPDDEEQYRIRVDYSPARKLAGSEGFVYVRCGAIK